MNNTCDFFLKKEDAPIVLGHRGVPLLHQENSISSFRRAVELGIDGIEFDVFKTKDDKAIVFHDKNAARLTGVDKDIIQMTWDEVSKLRIQRTIDGVTFPSEERIPLLEEVLDEFKGKLLMNIEIKPSEEKSTGTEVAKVIRKTNAENSVVITSFDPLMLHSLEKEYPALHSGFAYDDKPINDIGKLFKRLPDMFNVYKKFEKVGMNLLTMLLESNAVGRLIKSSVVDIEYTLIDSDTIQKFHERGMLVGAYTLFSNGNHDATQEQAVQRLVRNKVDWIETDDPERLQRMLHV